MRKEDKKKAVVLLSGGIDSATCLAYATSRGYECHALSFDYRQRHRIELKCAKKIAKRFNSHEHIVVNLDLRKWGGSALTSSSIKVPKGGLKPGIPITYVPARNMIFLSVACAFAEARGIKEIFIGVNSLDYSGYPDCRPQFIRSFEKTANLGTKSGLEKKKIIIRTPLQKMEKWQIIKLALSLGVDIGETNSCYDPGKNGSPCGKCDSCQIRSNAIKRLGNSKTRIF
ncbi:MAG TPA: 7-cyano-7-deazaguanine synthase QueC [Victivallales bacterium]|nr:7-cyano-7-deazaguanine synthase QueC [Victivallales bacterium]